MCQDNGAGLGQPDRFYGMMLIEKTGCHVKAIPAKQCRTGFEWIVQRSEKIL